MILRDYQSAAVNAVWQHLRTRDDNPCVVIPTGGGKTPVMAEICRTAVEAWRGRVLILAHVKELLEQSATTVNRFDIEHAIYSAGLGRREYDASVVVAGIQSVYRRAAEMGRFDLILVDECHLLPPAGEGMYRTFLRDARTVNPHVRLIGLTATPYRLGSGGLCGKDNLLNEIAYEVGVKELIVRGFLSRVRSKRGLRCDTASLHTKGGEFVAAEMEALHIDVVDAALDEIENLAKDRRSILLFCAGVEHATRVQTELRFRGHDCGLVTGDTPSEYRSETIRRFRSGDLRFLANVNVLTTGFDAPNVDCICLLRSTLSPGLYYQMVGRGLRLCDGKPDCLVLDFGGNVERHGPIDAIKVASRPGTGPAPQKECPKCKEMLAAGATVCPACGHAFPPPDPEKPRHSGRAGGEGILSTELPPPQEYEVTSVAYSVHRKRNAPDDHPRTLRVDYQFGVSGSIAEWVCVEHDGFARQKAWKWWCQRSFAPMPDNADEAVAVADAGLLATPVKVTIQQIPTERFPKLVKVETGPKPQTATPGSVAAVREWIAEAGISAVTVDDVRQYFPAIKTDLLAEQVVEAASQGYWDHLPDADGNISRCYVVSDFSDDEVPF